jgi:hypothetical protein
MSLVTVLISSFDGYSECWGPVCHGFRKYWPDCPYPVLLMTNTKDHPDEMVKVLKVGGGRDWSGRMITALERIETPYVMYFQEDYWINAPVETAKITTYVDLMERYGLNYIRLLSKPLPDRDYDHDPRLGVLDDQASYRTSVQITFWRREVFRDLLRAGESVWQFELNGTERSRKYGETFLSIKRHDGDDYYHGIRYICTAVNLGKWSTMARPYAAREGLTVDFSVLPSETWWDDFKRHHRLGIWGRRWALRANRVVRDPKLALRELGRRRAF